MVEGMFCWRTLAPLKPIDGQLDRSAYLSIVANHIPLMAAV